MSGLPRSLPKWLVLTIAVLVFVLLTQFCSCTALKRAGISTAGGTAIAILLLFTPFGWAAIPVAAVGGHIGGTIQAGDDIQEEAEKAAEKVITKYVDREVVKWQDREVEKMVPFVPRIVWACGITFAIWLAYRFRAGIYAFVATASTGGFMAALRVAWGLLVGGDAADKAKDAVTAHANARPHARSLRRLRTLPATPLAPAPATSPAVVVSSEVGPHA